MGIPSYFRRILQAYPGCLRYEPPKAKALCFDFNCLVYRCLRSPLLRPPPTSSCDPYEMEVWEAELQTEVVKTVKEVWTAAGRPPQVFLAVDGVVPMAKIRQQRVRRFKSAWLRSKAKTESWDSNAITPGTAFMEKLERVLQELVREHGAKWELSGASQAGEGEHKILQWLRNEKFHGEVGEAILVYGLDADLILLTMLVSEQVKNRYPLFLFREKMEFGFQKAKASPQIASPLIAQQEYQCMDIQEFKKRLGLESYDQVLNYIGIMSLMGNDFLPHSITHKLNDDGHEFVLEACRAKKQLVSKEGTLNLEVFREICSSWAASEEWKMTEMIEKKRDQAKRGVLPGMEESEGLPLEWMVENALMKNERELAENWKTTYWSWILPNQVVTEEEKKEICQEYVRGCQWILDYYTGKPVNKLWMFPSWLPPLWSDLAKVQDTPLTHRNEEQKDIQPQEQLSMVLPLESWGLVREKSLRSIPSQLPQYWPASFGFISAGRKWLWECEALIPSLSITSLREALRSRKET